jgi:hypothetical protein
LTLKKLCRSAVALLLLWLVAYPALAQLTVPVGGTVSLPPGGTLNLACTDLNDQGAFNVGSGQVLAAADINIAATGVLNGGSGTIRLGNSWNNLGIFNAGSGTVIVDDVCGAAAFQLTGSTIFNNLTLSSVSGRTFVIPSGGNIVVTGTLTLQGAPATPIQLISSSGTGASIALGPGAQVVQTNAVVAANVNIGSSVALNPIPTLGPFGLLTLMLLMAITAAITHYAPLSRARRRAPVVLQGDSNHEEK